MEYYLAKVDVNTLTAEEANSYMFRLKRFFRPPAFILDTDVTYGEDEELKEEKEEEASPQLQETMNEGQISEEQQTTKDQETNKSQISDQKLPSEE